VSLVARHLEANGISTVIVGSARDVVEHCGVPRFLFTDFPLGNPCGRPFDAAMQRRIVGHALDLLESATCARTTVQAPVVWSEDRSWKERYARVDPSRAEDLRRMGEERRALQRRAKTEGGGRGD
jgi:hypothetical protein